MEKLSSRTMHMMFFHLLEGEFNAQMLLLTFLVLNECIVVNFSRERSNVTFEMERCRLEREFNISENIL